MEGLDLSDLSDDQVVALARACCEEALRRTPAVQAALHEMMLTEAQRRKIAETATNVEAAAARAREREALYTAAAERERSKHLAEEARELADRQQRALEARTAQERTVVSSAADLLGMAPREISLLSYVRRDGGTQMHINAGGDRYTTDHIASYTPATGEITTRRAHIKAKPALIALFVAAGAAFGRDFFVSGDQMDWSI